jgi:hypothetical protein
MYAYYLNAKSPELIWINFSIPKLKKCGIYDKDLVDKLLKDTYSNLVNLPK